MKCLFFSLDVSRSKISKSLKVFRSLQFPKFFPYSLFFSLVPPAKPLLHATSATSNSISVQWKNADDGGASIRGYILHYKRKFGEWEEVKLSQKINSFLLSKLWCGTDYQIYLTAYNRIGMGQPSETINATTDGSKPENSPTNGDRFITVNVSWIVIHLSAWNDGGCPITYFELEYKRNKEDFWTLVSNNIEVIVKFLQTRYSPIFLRQVFLYRCSPRDRTLWANSNLVRLTRSVFVLITTRVHRAPSTR